MTDENGQAPSEAAPRPIPAPLPLSEGGSGGRMRKVWPWVVGAVLLVVLVGGCVGAVWLIGDQIDPLESDPGSSDDLAAVGSFGRQAVAWSGEGRYAVAQYYRDDSYPSVAVWDSKTDEARTVDGYRLLFVESAAPVAWLESITDEQVDESDSIDGYGDAFDHRPARLVAWRLDDGSKPTDNVSAKWRAWPGSADTIAYLEIDPLKGAAPSAILFNNSAGQGEGVKASVPVDVKTFVPIGWSPSGRYFAVESLFDEVTDKNATRSDPSGESTASRRLIIFDAMSGEVAGSHAIVGSQGVAPLAAWDGDLDTLYWPEVTAAADGPGNVSLRSCGATQAIPVDAIQARGWSTPEEFLHAYTVRSAGWDPAGPVYSVGGRIWQITADGPVDMGYVPATLTAGSWFPGAGLLSVMYGSSHGPVPQEWTEIVRFDIHGGSKQRVWQGPRTDLPPE